MGKTSVQPTPFAFRKVKGVKIHHKFCLSVRLQCTDQGYTFEFSLHYKKLVMMPTKGKRTINLAKKLFPVWKKPRTSEDSLWCLANCAKLTFNSQSESLRTLQSHALLIPEMTKKRSGTRLIKKSPILHIYLCIVWYASEKITRDPGFYSPMDVFFLNLFCSSLLATFLTLYFLGKSPLQAMGSHLMCWDISTS